MTSYTLTGNTYRNRNWLKNIGAQWNGSAWEINLGGNGSRSLLDTMRNRGIKADAA